MFGGNRMKVPLLDEVPGKFDRLRRDLPLLFRRQSRSRPPGVRVGLEKADVAMKVAMKVRNKILDAYNEVMRMSV